MTQESTEWVRGKWFVDGRRVYSADPDGWPGYPPLVCEVSLAYGNTTVKRAEEYAEFIARACNSHDSLLAALERLHLYVTDRDAFEKKYGAPKHPESSISIEGWLDVEVRGPVAKAIEEARP